MEVSSEWLKNRAALEGDLEIGVGLSIASPSPADIAELQTIAFAGLPEWARHGIASLRTAVQLADDIRAAQRAYMADRGNEARGQAVGEACAAYDAHRQVSP